MKTPICDFVEKYTSKNSMRLHMPGHKGMSYLGCESGDITEIGGADSLYEADGIIKMSEDNASSLFGVPTFYSTEGSSHCLRAMMFLVKSYAKISDTKSLVWAARNAHKAFISASALNDLEIEWLYGKNENSILSCVIDAKILDEKLTLAKVKPTAVYITSPDYLGNISDIESLANVCHKHNVLLCADSAHGAYMHFLENPAHPSDLGADMVCSSAHKTLPVLTGGAYLHLSDKLPLFILEKAKSALSFFGSTSPSYLVLSSLDRANSYLSDGYKEKLLDFTDKVETLKSDLQNMGYTLIGDEVLKISIDAKAYGYSGFELSKHLEENGIVCEFADSDFLVLMLSSEMNDKDMAKLKDAFSKLCKKDAIAKKDFKPSMSKMAMSVRDALLAETEEVATDKAKGRIFAKDNIACPPAVPIVMCGEEIDDNAIEIMKYYGIEKCMVVK